MGRSLIRHEVVGVLGAMEVIVATSLGGIVFALVEGQPLTILGGTDPMLISTAVLYDLAGRLELPWWIRQFLADFGSVIAIAIASATAIAFYDHEAGLPHLAVPDTFAPTSGRPWTVDLGAIPPWAILACLIPALLSTVLVFLDQNITARLVNQPRHQLKKGAAYHLDLLVVGLSTGFLSLFALPWLVAATVRSLNHVSTACSLNHVSALATVEERVRADGSSVEQIVGCESSA